MSKQVFLGGACGRTTWRKRIAIPALEAAGVSYYDPQLGIGEWTEASEDADMAAKDAADVLLFVINEETRGIATVGEAAYCLGAGQPLALVVTDIGENDRIDGRTLSEAERDDLNRGRLFIRSMARRAGVTVFSDVGSATRHAIDLVQAKRAPLNVEQLRSILADVRFKDGRFLIEETRDGFLIQLWREEKEAVTGERKTFCGRKWHVDASATRSDIVRTAFKAVVTWEEHEAREGFTYRGAPVFGAHGDVDGMVRLFESQPQRSASVTAEGRPDTMRRTRRGPSGATLPLRTRTDPAVDSKTPGARVPNRRSRRRKGA